MAAKGEVYNLGGGVAVYKISQKGAMLEALV